MDQCGTCAWEQQLSKKTRERRAENAAIRELVGDMIPVMARGTDRQCAWATDIATETITRMPRWLWEIVSEETAQAGFTELSDAKFWIEHREMGFYGFLALILHRCLNRIKATPRTDPKTLPTRLIALMLYLGPAGELAESPKLDELLSAHPIQDADTVHLFTKRNSFPLHIWGEIAAGGLVRIDPDATAVDWILKATQSPQAPFLERCLVIPWEQVSEDSPVIVLTTDNTWMTLGAASWSEEEQAYTVTIWGGSAQRRIRADEIETCFFPAGEQG